MLKNKWCYLCLSNDKRTINIYKTDLQNIYENLADIKIGDAECWMCYICHTRLRQCHRLQQLAVQTRGLINDLNVKNMMSGTFGTPLQLSIHSETSFSLPPPSHIKQEPDVKTEPVDYDDDDDGSEHSETQECANYDAKDTESYIKSEDPLSASGSNLSLLDDRSEAWQESSDMSELNESNADSPTGHKEEWKDVENTTQFSEQIGTMDVKQERIEDVGDIDLNSDLMLAPHRKSKCTEIVDRNEFNRELKKYYSSHNINSKKVEWTSRRIQNVIKLLEESSTMTAKGIRRTNKHYHHERKYDVVDIGSEKILILKRKDLSDPIIEIIPTEEYYQKILYAHVATRHGRRDKVVHTLKDKYVVPIFAVNIFLNLCKVCLSKRTVLKRGVVKPLISEDFNRRGQIDVIDFQNSPDKKYKWLLQYQDVLTKFCFLRPLKSNHYKEVAGEVLKIFLVIGCPHILQSDNGDFTASVVKEIDKLWPACKVVNGRYPQSKEVEVDVRNMIQTWMTENQSTKWSMGCYYVQFQKNSTYHPAIARTPYKALFGQDPKLGLLSTCLPKDIISKVEKEEDIEKIMKEIIKNKEENRDNYLDEGNTIDAVKIDKQNIKDDTTATHNVAEKVKVEINIEQINDVQHNPRIISDIYIRKPDSNQQIYYLNSTPRKDTSLVKNITAEQPIAPRVVPFVGDIGNTNDFVCNICKEEASGAQICVKCKKIIHATCGLEEKKGKDIQLICYVCVKTKNEGTSCTRKRTADTVVPIASKLYKDNMNASAAVIFEIPKVGIPLDSKKSTGKVVINKNDLYAVGIIKNWTPNTVVSYPNELIGKNLQVASPRAAPRIRGQLIKYCNCKIVRDRQCAFNRCHCKKANIPCNDRCHQSLTCNNK